MPADSVKLHLGCGTKKLDGWVNIDSVAACAPDVVHDIAQPLPYADESVDEILAEDLLEHFDKYLRYLVMADWARVLKVGGRVTVQVPNFKKILFKYFKFGFDNFVDFIFGENMLRSEIYAGRYGNHKMGYSEKSLTAFMQAFGIECMSCERTGLNLRFTGKKQRHIPLEQLDTIMIYSHANDHGIGEAYLPLSTVREKIKQFHQNQ